MIGGLIFIVIVLVIAAVVIWLGKTPPTHGADHNAIGTRQFWSGFGA